jgi:hypothetical protein
MQPPPLAQHLEQAAREALPVPAYHATLLQGLYTRVASDAFPGSSTHPVWAC